MILVAFDPGLRNTGWGIIDSTNSQISYIGSGNIKTDSKKPIETRLLQINQYIEELMSRHNPESVAIEESLLGKSPKSAILLAHARGAIILSLASNGLSIHQYSPRHVKLSVTGKGNAKKEQVEFMIQKLLPRAKIKSHDEADALAVAVCHAHHVTSPQYMNLQNIKP